MGLPALLSTLSELEQEVVEAAAAIPAAEKVQAPIEVLSEKAKKTERLLSEIKPTLTRIFAEIEEAATAIGGASQDYISGLIDQLAEREATLAKRILPMIDAAHKLRASTFRAQHLNREEKTRYVLVFERQAKALSAVLSLFRDERWRMMALRAKVQPVDDAVAFKNPEDLEAYLDKL